MSRVLIEIRFSGEYSCNNYGQNTNLLSRNGIPIIALAFLRSIPCHFMNSIKSFFDAHVGATIRFGRTHLGFRCSTQMPRLIWMSAWDCDTHGIKIWSWHPCGWHNLILPTKWMSKSAFDTQMCVRIRSRHPSVRQNQILTPMWVTDSESEWYCAVSKSPSLR